MNLEKYYNEHKEEYEDIQVPGEPYSCKNGEGSKRF